MYIVKAEPVILPVTEVTLEPVMKLNVGNTVLNCQPVGAVRMSVFVMPPLAPFISEFEPSVIVIVPKVVNAGDAPPTALLLQMSVPPVAAVTVTAAKPAWLKQQRKSIKKDNLTAIVRPLTP